MTSNALVRLRLVLLVIGVGGLLSLPSCAEDAPGIEMLVGYRGELTMGEVVASMDAQRVRLTSAHVAVDSLELVACPPPRLARVARFFSPAVARAHSARTATRIGTPVVVDGLTDEVLRPGSFLPPPDAYCGVRGRLAMPDADALVADPSAPLDAVVTLSGERLGPDGEVLGTFLLRSTMNASFERTFDEPLWLDASTPPAEAQLVVDALACMAAITLPDGALDAAGTRALSQAVADTLRFELVRPTL